ncbi:ferritin-like domain-containing protein [Candidatus Peregrinibacteria bacterium]|nr:ferritin-like domain-containing protein [Candidatus Peregrinibacteria bacterium]
MTKEEMIDLLNKDLTKEYAAAVQYIQHAAKVTGAQYQSIQKELIVHANEEIGHAVILAEQIASLGGDPTIEVDKRYVSDDTPEMLKQDLEGELDAVKRYKERVAQANELGEYGLKRALEDILIMEEEHARDLQAALGM